MPRLPIRDSLSLDPPSTHPCPVHTPNSFATFVVRITRVMPLFFDTGAGTFSESISLLLFGSHGGRSETKHFVRQQQKKKRTK